MGAAFRTLLILTAATALSRGTAGFPRVASSLKSTGEHRFASRMRALFGVLEPETKKRLPVFAPPRAAGRRAGF